MRAQGHRLKRMFATARWSVVAFLVLSSVSLQFYPGGTYRDRASVGYRFFSNFLSDLAREASVLSNAHASADAAAPRAQLARRL